LTSNFTKNAEVEPPQFLFSEKMMANINNIYGCKAGYCFFIIIAALTLVVKGLDPINKTPLVGVSHESSSDLVTIVSEFIPDLGTKACKASQGYNVQEIDVTKRAGEWVMSSVAVKGIPRDFWYNENTHESRWADKFKPPRRVEIKAQEASNFTPFATADTKLIDCVKPLTYDHASPLCALNQSSAFVSRQHAPDHFCVHFLGITQSITRRQMAKQTRKGMCE
jgi:hypothetical protein